MSMATPSDFTVRTSGIGYYPDPVEATRKQELAYMELQNETTGETRWFYLKPTGEFAVYRGVETAGRIVSLVSDTEEPLDIAVDLNLFSGEMCHFKDLGAESLAKRQVEILTFFGEVEKTHASHGADERKVKVQPLDELTMRELEAMEDSPAPHSPTHVRRHSMGGTADTHELVVTAESFPGAPVLSQLELQRAHSVVHDGGKEKDTGVGSSTGVEHLQVPKPTERERDPVAKMPDSPRPATEQSGFAKWFANCQCSRRTKIVGLTAIAFVGASIAAYVAIQKGYVNAPTMPDMKMPDLSSWREYMPWQEKETTETPEGTPPNSGTPQTGTPEAPAQAQQDQPPAQDEGIGTSPVTPPREEL